MADAVRFALSAFADEISPDLDVQVAALKRLGVAGLDLRSVGGVNVLDLDADALRRVGDACAEAGLHVQAIGSPVNKVAYRPENEAPERAKLERAIEAAKALGVRRIRLFTPEAPEERSGEVLAWMREQRKMAEDHDVVLLHENDARFWGAYPPNARVLFEELGGEHFKAAFDFANTVLIGYRPMTDWFPWILPYLDTLHIKDAVEAEHQVVPAGQGDGQLAETLGWLIEKGWNGPLTLEPHLQAAGPLGGFSGEQLFETAVGALRDVLRQAGGEA